DRPIVATCSNELAEIDFVLSKVRELAIDGIAYRDIAILSRRKIEGTKFARALRSRGIPYTFVGDMRIFSTSLVRDLLAYLRAAADPLSSGIDLARIMLAHGVSEQDVKIVNHTAKARVRALLKNTREKQGSRADTTDGNRNYGNDFVYAA